MQYIILPAEVFEQADIARARALGLDKPRRSVDGTEVIMHVESYERLFPSSSAGTRKTRRSASYPIYDSDTSEFAELLASDAWASEEEIP
ncbi:MAG: hypothetical protein K2M06_01870 [Muribaculaceae bacterium]|nr:hypothetical protein [Muribaculaceae bacterium]